MTTPFNPPRVPRSNAEPKKVSRTTMWRHARAQKSAERGCGCIEQGLPLVHANTDTKVEVEERFHYQEHRQRHLAAHPDYDAGWARPSAETAEAICNLLRTDLPALEAIHPDPLTAKQLIVVTLDVAVTAGRYGHRVEDRHDDPRKHLRSARKAVTRTTLTNAIMRRWSDHARLAREQERAYSITQMTETTARQCWRDLLVQEIQLPVLWRLIVDAPTSLFRVRPSRYDVTRDSGTGAVVGYGVTLRRGADLRAFEKRVRNDGDYSRSRLAHTWRLWIAGRRMPAIEVHAPICAERKYNVVEISDETRAALKLQEDARLMFDSHFFVGDYRSIQKEWKRVRRELRERFPAKISGREQSDDERKLRVTEVKLQAFLWEYRAVFEQAVPLRRRTFRETPFPGLVPIRSAFYKVLNRRYQAAHFWLTQVTGRKDQVGRQMIADETANAVRRGEETFPSWYVSPRARWFQAMINRRASKEHWPATAILMKQMPGLTPSSLVSMDISASQTQLQAVLLGLDDMEQDAVLSRRPHKEALAERAWAAHGAEQPLERIEADREKALKIETRRYRLECKKVQTDLVENHVIALAVIEKHKMLVANIEAKLNAIASPYGPLLIGYKNARDSRLIEMMKNLWMVLGYGETINGILRKQAKDPDRYGQGWRQIPTKLAIKFGTDDTTLDYMAVTNVLAKIPGYTARADFLVSCKDAVQRHSHGRNGLRLVDPLDGIEFEWNLPHKAAVPLRLNDWDLTLVKPGTYHPLEGGGKLATIKCLRCNRPTRRRRGARWFCTAWTTVDGHRVRCNHVWKATFYEQPLDEQGRPALDCQKLRKMLAPCIIHMLDSLFASFVMEALAADDVKDFVSVHDCWWVAGIVHRAGREPELGHVVLDRAIKAAGKPWLLALWPVYKWMLEYIGGAQIEQAYEKWDARVKRGLAGDETAWPYFYAVPSGGADSPDTGKDQEGQRAISGNPSILPGAR